VPGAPEGSLRVEALAPHYDRISFASGVKPLDRYFRSQAGQDARKNMAAPFVLVLPDGAIGGYYTLSATGVKLTEFPVDVTRKGAEFCATAVDGASLCAAPAARPVVGSRRLLRSPPDQSTRSDFGETAARRFFFFALNDQEARIGEWPLLADFVANIENRTMPKISRKRIFRRLYRCNAL
jgi:hypothetical protein